MIAIGISTWFAMRQQADRGSRFYEVLTVTYDGEQYYSEAFAMATSEIRRWLAEDSDSKLRENVVSVVVYPSEGSGMMVGCELKQFNSAHLTLLSQEAGRILYRSPRRPATTRKANKSEQATPRKTSD